MSGAVKVASVYPLALRATSNATMTMDFSDIDRDGDEDFILIDMLDRDSRLQITINAGGENRHEFDLVGL